MLLTGIFFPVSRLFSLFDQRIVPRLTRIFLWTEQRTVGWLPVLSFQSGFGLSFGARVFHQDLFGNQESISLEAHAGGLYSQSYQLRFNGNDLGGTRLWLNLLGRFDMTPRLVFSGIGSPPEVSTAQPDLDPRRARVRTRYSQRRGLAAAALGWRFGSRDREVRPGGGLVFNHRTFDRKRDDQSFIIQEKSDPSIEEVYDIERIPAFTEGVDIVRLFARLELDFRNHRGGPSRGFYYVAMAGGAPPQARGVGYGHYGSELSGYFDLFHGSRVIVLRAALEAVHGGSRAVPFSELPRLGGPIRLRGHRLNSLRDHIAVLATAEYRYPIHQLIGGHLFFDVGRVAKDYRELFESRPLAWRKGIGAGFDFRTRDRLFFRIDFSYGDEFLLLFSLDPLHAFAGRHMLEL